MVNSKKTPYILYVGTYPPRECGIATFTRDLTTAIDKTSSVFKSKIERINNEPYSHDRKGH